MVGLAIDINNPLLVLAGLSRPIQKIRPMFAIDHLSRPTPILCFLVAAHLSSRHELWAAIFCGGYLSGAPQKLFFLIILFVIYVNKYFRIHYYNICH
jgi:hypothetical protein